MSLVFKEQLTNLVQAILSKITNRVIQLMKKGESRWRKRAVLLFSGADLSLLLSLVATSIQSVQAAAARTQILNSMDIGLYSLFDSMIVFSEKL